MSAKQDARIRQILSMLSEQKKIEVSALAEAVGMSQVTVRKDLDLLEARGFIRRVHGYAELNTTDLISSRLAYHYAQKRRIAERAAQLVHDGDTVMIESGSCCALLADVLARSRDGLTILTNSAFIADYIRDCRNTQVVLLGGVYQPLSQCLVGPLVRLCAENYHVPLFFVGADGWSRQTGFTNKDQLRAQAVRDMSRACERLVVLTESEKFAVTGVTPLNVPDRPKALITDAALPDAALAALTDEGVEVILVGQ